MGGVLALALHAALAAEPPRYGSEAQRVTFEDTNEVFSLIAFDTGYLPDINDPISVRFHITPTGGVVSALDAEAFLEWTPEGGYEVQAVGVPGTGELAVETEVEVEAEVHIDIFGLFGGSVPLWSEYVTLEKSEDFDPLLMTGGDAASVALTGAGLVDPFEFGVTVFTGLDLVLAVDLYPTLDATLMGTRVDVLTDGGQDSQWADGEWAQLPVDGAAAELPATLTYVADLDTLLSFVVEPAVELDTFLGSFTLVAFPIDVPLIDTLAEWAFPPVDVRFPLPQLGVVPEGLDAGSVDLDALANVPLTLTNDGLLPLEGVWACGVGATRAARRSTSGVSARGPARRPLVWKLASRVG